MTWFCSSVDAGLKYNSYHHWSISTCLSSGCWHWNQNLVLCLLRMRSEIFRSDDNSQISDVSDTVSIIKLTHVGLLILRWWHNFIFSWYDHPLFVFGHWWGYLWPCSEWLFSSCQISILDRGQCITMLFGNRKHDQSCSKRCNTLLCLCVCVPSGM